MPRDSGARRRGRVSSKGIGLLSARRAQDVGAGHRNRFKNQHFGARVNVELRSCRPHYSAPLGVVWKSLRSKGGIICPKQAVVLPHGARRICRVSVVFPLVVSTSAAHMFWMQLAASLTTILPMALQPECGVLKSWVLFLEPPRKLQQPSCVRVRPGFLTPC